MLARRQSLDLLDGLDMDFLGMAGGVGGGLGGMGGDSGFSYEDDFFFDQQYDGAIGGGASATGDTNSHH